VQGWLYTGTRVATYWYKGGYILVQGWLYTGTRVATYWYKGSYILVQGWLYTSARVVIYWYKGGYILVQGWLYTGTRVATYWYKGGYMGTAFSDTVLYTGNLYAQDLCCDNSSYRCDRTLVDVTPADSRAAAYKMRSIIENLIVNLFY